MIWGTSWVGKKKDGLNVKRVGKDFTTLLLRASITYKVVVLTKLES